MKFSDDLYSQIETALALKLINLQRNNLSTITMTDLKNALFKSKWKGEVPENLNQAIDDIMKIKASEIVNYITNDVQVSSLDTSIEDYSDLLRG
ncbi:MAG: post-transcriptional regulator [Erysipelotrichaceae bacterium]